MNVLALPTAPPVSDLAAIGVSRVSVGGAFAFAAYGALLAAGQQLLGGSYGFWDGAAAGRAAFGGQF